jgi:sRNA-binding regulator protein Hfq
MSYQMEDVRNQQVKDVRNTLRIKNPQRPFKPRKPFVAKGHDALLKGLQDSGADVTVCVNGDIIVGKIIARDKFTVTLNDGGIDSVLIYKSAIETIRYRKALTAPVVEE